MKRGAIDHWKMRRLAKAIGKPPYAALGLMEALTDWAKKYHPNGSLGKCTDAEIEEAVGWDDAEGTMVPLLIDAGFLENHPEHRVVIHDWYDHADDSVHMSLARAGERFWCGRAPKLTRLSRAERERVEAAYRDERTSEHTDARTSTRTANARKTHGERTENALPCLALPSPALPSPPMGNGPSVLAFWHEYPKHKRKSQGEVIAEWSKAIEEGADPTALVSACREYAASPLGKSKFAVEAPRWLRDRCWLDDRAAWQDDGSNKPKETAKCYPGR